MVRAYQHVKTAIAVFFWTPTLLRAKYGVKYIFTCEIKILPTSLVDEQQNMG
jgi:hypothetical protein